MKIICISDTHNKKVNDLPPGDLLIHAGDMSSMGYEHEIINFNKWLGKIKDNYTHGVVMIPGNHDFLFETDFQIAKDLMTNATVLNDSGIEIEGIKIWGSPVSPEFGNWAFNRARTKETSLDFSTTNERYDQHFRPICRNNYIGTHWDMIPDHTNVLITHGPVYGILDVVEGRIDPLGCEVLADRIKDLKYLKLHVCGHIHSGHGHEVIGGVNFVNASVLDEYYDLAYEPIIIELEDKA